LKIKKFEARTEQEAIEKVKNELGLSALILNIKKTSPKGIFALFAKPLVEVTAAYSAEDVPAARGQDIIPDDMEPKARAKTGWHPFRRARLEAAPEPPVFDNLALQEEKAAEIPFQPEVYREPLREPREARENPAARPAGETEETILSQQKTIDELEKKLSANEELLEKMMVELRQAGQRARRLYPVKYENEIVQLFFDTLLAQGVTIDLADAILAEVGAIRSQDQEKIDVNFVVKVVYNTIMEIFGDPPGISLPPEDGCLPVVLKGPTGVGKTTTIAKLSSKMILDEGKKVGFITADTYRIAAVEQLKIYAEILGVETKVVYNATDMRNHVRNLKKNHEYLFIDTAGRSHKNAENLAELSDMLKAVGESERFLVVSNTTNFDDLLNIVNIYSSISDFKLIFTKLDETRTLGSLLNICYLTGKKISFVTTGQNVPDDIEVAAPDRITKLLLGMGGEGFNGSDDGSSR